MRRPGGSWRSGGSPPPRPAGPAAGGAGGVSAARPSPGAPPPWSGGRGAGSPGEKVGPQQALPRGGTEPAAGPGLLARGGPWRVGVREGVLALLAPPLGWAAGYAVWRRLSPGAARAARLRRGRAARRALDALAR